MTFIFCQDKSTTLQYCRVQNCFFLRARAVPLETTSNPGNIFETTPTRFTVVNY
jgi:hypothetical protein